MRYPTILLALFCVACGSYSANVPTIKPYKMDIQQGNVVTSKMMMQLRPGMNKSQVRFIMGTPLLIDSFHADRWDYFYQMRKQGKIIEQRRVMLEFEGDTLARVRGDVVPAGTDAAGQPSAAVVPKPAKAAPKEKGLLDKLKFWDDDEPVPPKTQSDSVEQTKAAPMTSAPQPVADEAAKSEAGEAPLPPLMDESMQPKPEPVQAAPQVQQPVAKPAATKPVAQPKPQAATVPASKPAEAPTGAKADTAGKTPAAKSQPQTERAMTAPQPPSDLPPEDAPDFFEKMLEKIGF